MAHEHLEQLIMDLKESLERDITALSEKVDRRFEGLESRFEAQAARLDRQAALLQLGSRWTNRMNGWADRMDRQQEATAKTIAEINERIAGLEGRQPS